jgi:hypothetical protein
MNKTIIAIVGFIGIGLVGAVVLLIMGMSLYNSEITLRNTITAKQTDNKNQMDAMWKNISQVAQVTEEQKKALIEIFSGYAQARSGDNKGGSLANWIHEAVPNVDTSTFNNLQNIIVAQRDGFKFRQTELLDLGREHDNLIMKFPGNVFGGFFGWKHIDLVIVTSTRTEDSFKSGKDDNVDLFPSDKK